MKLTPISFDPFDNPARRIARAEGGMALQRTAPFPDAPEGYEFYGPTDEPAKEKDFIPGVGSEGVQAYSPDVQENAAPGILGTAATDIADWYKNQPSWMERAGKQGEKDWENYQKGGVEGMFADTHEAQDLAGGFAGSTTPVARAASEIAQPFYSAVSKAISETPQPKASGEQWAATLRNRPGVKPEEMEWTGLEDWLKEQKGPVTKHQVADYVRDNQVQVQDVMKGDLLAHDIGAQMVEPIGQHGLQYLRTPQDIADASRHNAQFRESVKGMSDADILAAADRLREAQKYTPTKFSQYTLHGGENYRELLLTLPEGRTGDAAKTASDRASALARETADAMAEWKQLAEENAPGHPETLAAYDRVKEARIRQNLARNESIELEKDLQARQFHSSHFDEPNILAHIRFNDRTIDGKKTLFVEEVQSDWHQKGKREGYRSDQPPSDELPEGWSVRQAPGTIYAPDAPSRVWEAVNPQGNATGLRFEAANQADAARQAARQVTAPAQQAVPDAPFKTTWPELAMKRIIRYAAENGYDKVAWTPGEVQAARYDLSKSISRLSLSKFPDGKLYLQAFDKEPKEVIARHVTEAELPDLIGKEAADKLINKEPNEIKKLPIVSRKDIEITSREHDWLARTPDGREVNIGKGTEHTLDGAQHYAERYFNKEAHQINQKRELQGSHRRELSGLDLKIGGEGMKGFYDQMLPAAVNKLVKKHGVKVGKSEMPGGSGAGVYDRGGNLIQEFNTVSDAHLWDQLHPVVGGGREIKQMPQSVHSLDITPSLRKSAMEQGFPQFAKGGPVKADKGRQRLTPVSHDPFEVNHAIRRAIHGN